MQRPVRAGPTEDSALTKLLHTFPVILQRVGEPNNSILLPSCSYIPRERKRRWEIERDI
jgi:hypothetical protein